MWLKKLWNSCHHPHDIPTWWIKEKLKFLTSCKLNYLYQEHRSSKINFFPVLKIRLLFITKYEINGYKRRKKFDLTPRQNKLAWTGSNSNLESWADPFGNLPEQTADVYILFLSLLLLFPPSPLRHFQFRGSIFAAAKKTACASLRKKEFCQQSYLRTKKRGKAFDSRRRICLSNREGIRLGEKRFSNFADIYDSVSSGCEWSLSSFADREQKRMIYFVYFYVVKCRKIWDGRYIRYRV